jgi:hypothetical protein
MHDSQEHIFTDEFDDVRVTISLNMGGAAASMRIAISDRGLVWNELFPTDTSQHKDPSDLCAFEGGL